MDEPVRPSKSSVEHIDLAALGGSDQSESLITVLVALAVNVLVALAKAVAAVVTGSASLLAESAHSFADSGNEVFLFVANRRARRPPEVRHPLGHGREAYVWSLFAALGLFVAGASVSIAYGIEQLVRPEAAEDFIVGYIVLIVSFVLEAVSFTQSIRQARPQAAALQRDLIEYVLATSDPTLRAVFAEDAAALIGLGIAAVGLGLHQSTGSAIPDAIASIVIGVLLAAVAFVLINTNRRFLVGEQAEPRVRLAVLQAFWRTRGGSGHLPAAGDRRPEQITVVGDVDLVGDETESHVAVRLRALEAKLSASPAVIGAVLSLSAPDEPSLSA